ncbi:hypothetical protein C7974DRAFT_313491 [Boeremia exigua]|uniref:uncharacterized protein n=1 Tax=Boeremia exigua TaxID=749465 RepID=UPI001E8CB0C2|nr:uncharacterized protein C7974DRAFT_313491 [Boeremia exigua]KAH6625587.1 hypothetical protein C7974DRAFT_313491 [Boeremia exigua]
MKFTLLLGVVFLFSFVVALTVPQSASSIGGKDDHSFNFTTLVDVGADWTDDVTTTANDEQKWASNVARGRKLLAAMKGTDAEAAAIWKMEGTAKSSFDGDLKTEMKQWGWNDNPDKQKKALDPQCDVAVYHKIGRAFEELGLGTKSKNAGGPNECFIAEHWSGPTIKKNLLGKLPKPEDQKYKACDGNKYRVTLDRKSPAHGAAQLWGRTPEDRELPHIRSSSDVTWAFWNRATAGGDITNIKYFFNCLIVNPETQDLIRQAHEKMTPPRSAPGMWPGTEFSMDSEQGLALLGSPLGRSHGFFLIQHKEKLGRSKFISKARVFKSDAMSMPYIVFYVQSAVAGARNTS